MPTPRSAFEPDAAGAADNPFLHMGLHLAVREQLLIDRPPGNPRFAAPIAGAIRRIRTVAEHVLMEALGEELWMAQREGRAPDEQQLFGARAGSPGRPAVKSRSKVNEASCALHRCG